MTTTLKMAREQAGVSIEEVAKKLKIRRQYLAALEDNNLSDIPGEVYAQGYLKMYASYLGVNLNEFSNIYAENSDMWSPKNDRLSKFSTEKIILSLSLLGILTIFSWYSITDKVEINSEISLISRLNQVDNENSNTILLDKNLIDEAAIYISREKTK